MGSKDDAGVVTVPAWREFPWLRAGFSTRQGGGSSVYGGAGEQNLGFTQDDAPKTVATNRERFLGTVQGKNKLPLLTVGQFHSGTIQVVSGAAEIEAKGWMTADGQPALRGDGLLCATPGLMLGIVTADCVPVLLADTRTHAVGAFHAGWRGALARIVEHGVESMRLRFGSRVENLVAVVGPGIGACCFVVGDEVKGDFEKEFRYSPELFSDVTDSGPVTARASGDSNIGPQIHLDLVAANRRQLLEAGLPGANISVVGECTACTRLENGRRKYFSHRAEHGFTGRMLSVVGAVE